MLLKTIREKRNISRKQLADNTGLSVRTIQDYEQGHKDLYHAGYDSIEKICAYLGCTSENIFSTAPEDAVLQTIKNISFYSPEYNVFGCWHQSWDKSTINFLYKNKIRSIEFKGHVSKENLPCMQGIAIMMMEDYIDDLIGEEKWQMLRTTF